MWSRICKNLGKKTVIHQWVRWGGIATHSFCIASALAQPDHAGISAIRFDTFALAALRIAYRNRAIQHPRVSGTGV